MATGLLELLGGSTGDPKRDSAINQGLLQMGLQMLQSKGSFGQALGQGGMAGIQATNQAQDRQFQQEQQQQTRQQWDEQQRQRAQQQKQRELMQKFYKSPEQTALAGGGGPTTANAQKIGAPSYDFQGYAEALAQYDPMASMELKQRLAKPTRKLTSVAPGASLVDEATGQAVYSAPAKDDSPSAVKEYQFAKSQGYPGTFEQFQIAQRRAGASSVNVNTTQEKEESKAVGKFLGEQYADIQKAGIGAQSKLDRAARMEQLLTRINTGKFEGVKKEAAAVAQGLGLTIDPNLGDKEAFEALSNQLALEARNPSGGAGMPGAMSDKDREFLVNITPNLSKTPEGNRTIIDTSKKLAKREAEVAKMAREYRAKNGTIDEGFFEVLRQHSEANPLFDSKDGNDLGGGFRLKN